MAITTRVKKGYAVRMHAIAVVCLVLGLWGAYDLWVKIPKERAEFLRYDEIQKSVDELGAHAAEIQAQGRELSPAEKDEYDRLREELQAVTADGVPVEPSTFNELTQWGYILLLPCTPYCWLLLRKTRARVYELDDDGTLHMPDGTWAKDDIADIDMDRWMAKSIAHVVHQDGTRVKLDDYIFQDLHLIIGRLASARYPELWEEDARQVKKEQESEAAVAETDSSEQA